MRPRIVLPPLLIMLVALACSATPNPHEPDVARMQVETLRDRLGEAGLAIIDVGIRGDWTDSDKMIQGAIRRDPNDVSLWADNLDKEQTIVLYCA